MAKVQRLRDQIVWDDEVDIVKLRHFVADAFEWRGVAGAKKFVRGLAPVLLVLKLRQRGDRRSSGYDDVVLTKINEMGLVRAICGQRRHFSTDEMPEMRVIYHPLEIVGIDLDDEQDDEDDDDYGRDGLAPLLDDDQIEAYVSDNAAAVDDTPRKRASSLYDPTKADKLWVPETLVKVGVPLTAEDYEESLRDPRKFIKQTAAAKKAATKKTATGSMRQGALDAFVEVSKRSTRNTAKTSSQPFDDLQTSQDNLPPTFLAPTLNSPKSPAPTAVTKRRTRAAITIKDKSKPRQNPWDISQSSSTELGVTITKASQVRPSSTRIKESQTFGRSRSPEPKSCPTPLSSTKGEQSQRLKQPPKRNSSTISQSSSQPSSSMPKSPRVQRGASPIKRFQVYSLSTSPESETEPVPTSLSTPPSASSSKKHNRESPVPFSDDDDLPSHHPQKCDNPSTRKRRSPYSTRVHVLSSSPAPTPLTPQPVNRKIDFSLHSSAAKSSSSSSSYNTAASQIVDLSSSSPPQSPRSPPHSSLSKKSSPYQLNASAPIPKATKVNDLASPEQKYLEDMGLSVPITPSLNASTPIPVSIIELNDEEQEYLDHMGLTSNTPQSHDYPENLYPNPSPTPSPTRKPTQQDQERYNQSQENKQPKKRYIMLRESLPGFWREVGREELVEGRSRAWRGEEVEVVDLTGE